MERLKQFQERRLELADKIKALAARQSTWTATDRREWSKLNREYDSNMELLNAEQARVEAEISSRHGVTARLADLDAWNDGLPANLGRGGDGTEGERRRQMFQRGGNDAVSNAICGWVGSQFGRRPTEAEDNALRALNISAGGNSFEIPLPTFAIPRVGLVTNNMGTGGFPGAGTVPETFLHRLETAMQDEAPMIELAEIIRTNSGEPMRWPNCDDSSVEGSLIGEGVDVGDATERSIGNTVFNAVKATSGIIKLTNELVQDSGLNIVNVVADMLGARLGRTVNRYATLGGGGGMEPAGIVPNASVGVTTASATAIAADEILELVASVRQSYRDPRRAKFMMHPQTALHLRKLKDGEGRHLFIASLLDTQADRLAGFPLRENAHMADTLAAGARSIVFGDFTKFKIRLVGRLRIVRLNERFAETDEIGLVAYTRFDAAPVDPGGHGIKCLLQGS